MEYTVAGLARLSGISGRTLRYYDKLGLLAPRRVNSNGYRIYGGAETERLQQILFYRELGVALEDIKVLLDAPDFGTEKALASHLSALLEKRERLDALIANVQKTIQATKGEINMSDMERFEGFAEKLIEENEARYGEEIRTKYGDDAVNRSNAKLRGKSREDFLALEALSLRVNEAIKAAHAAGDPASPLAQEACALHKEWLCHYWDSYSKEAHMGVAQMYVDDERFAAYYDAIAPGCAIFLRDAIHVYCG